jgi:hypothetical protein
VTPQTAVAAINAASGSMRFPNTAEAPRARLS